MKAHPSSWIAAVLALVCATPWSGHAEEKPDEAAIEVQTRGPIHEAYAQPTNLDPKPGPVVPKEPPKPIPENPPDQKPQGDNVRWIPGYWAWDADKNDFLWVSGCWRVPPPGRKWLPGHWAKAEGGWQWAPGFWAPEAQDDFNYLPAPPASIDIGPSSPMPDEDSLYLPGSWIYRDDNRYWWRPGYWIACRPDWIWNPACYYWTPAGYCFCSGYWDYCLPNRGLLFAPVCFARPLWATPGWCYTPGYCLNPGGLFSCLFVGPYRHNYYFGNYYAASYGRLGFRPWYAYGGAFHNTLLAHSRWANRGDPAWFQNLRAEHQARVNGTSPVPALTLAAQNALPGTALHTVTALNQLRDPGIRLSRVQPAELKTTTAAAQALQQVQGDRIQSEQPGAARVPSLRTTDAVTGAPAKQLPEIRQAPGPTSSPPPSSTSPRSSTAVDQSVPMPRILRGAVASPPAGIPQSFRDQPARPSIAPYQSPRTAPSYQPAHQSPAYHAPSYASPGAHSSSAPSHGSSHGGRR